MRILVTGKNGQLGRSIQKIVNTDTKIGNNQSPNDFIFVGREELDLSSESSISHYFEIIISLILSLTAQPTRKLIKQSKRQS